MSEQHVQADKLKLSAEDPAQHNTNGAEEEQVERSYTENNAGNAQDAVNELLSNMSFLERKNDLLYSIPQGCPEPTCLHALTVQLQSR